MFNQFEKQATLLATKELGALISLRSAFKPGTLKNWRKIAINSKLIKENLISKVWDLDKKTLLWEIVDLDS